MFFLFRINNRSPFGGTLTGIRVQVDKSVLQHKHVISDHSNSIVSHFEFCVHVYYRT